MALYKLYNTDEGTQGVRKNLTNFNIAIPFHPDNTDYQEFLQWKADGGVPEEAD